MSDPSVNEDAARRLNTILCLLPHKWMLSNTYDGRVQLCAFVQTPDGRLLHPTVAVWRTHSDAMAFIQEHALDNVADKTMEANSNDATPVIWKVHETTDDELRGLLEASTKA